MLLKKSLPLLILLISCATISAYAQNWVLEWSDEFDSTEIDTSKWSFQIGNGGPELPGWGNNELEYYTDRPENARIEDSILIIEARKEFYSGSQYTSARLRTWGKVDFQFGKIVARMKLPKGQGIWPAFWMLPAKESFTWPTDGEIDIMELVGHEPNISYGTIHYGPVWPNNQNKGCPYVLSSGDFIEDFHEFSIEWKTNSIRWFIDDNFFCQMTPSSLTPHSWPFNNHPFYILLNLAVGGNWPGNPDSTTEFPQKLEVDYVRYYKDVSTSVQNNLPEESGFSIKVYQDLVAHNFSIESNFRIEKISIIDIYGKTVIEESPQSTKHRVSTEGLPRGIYFLRATHKGLHDIHKVVL